MLRPYAVDFGCYLLTYLLNIARLGVGVAASDCTVYSVQKKHPLHSVP